LLYFKLPSRAQMKDGEGYDVTERAAQLSANASAPPANKPLVGELGDPAGFLSPRPKARTSRTASNRRWRFVVHAGPASADSGFAISKTFCGKTARSG